MRITDRELHTQFAVGSSMRQIAALWGMPEESVEIRLRDRFRRMRLHPRIHYQVRDYCAAACGRHRCTITKDADMVTCRTCLRAIEAAEKEE